MNQQSNIRYYLIFHSLLDLDTHDVNNDNEFERMIHAVFQHYLRHNITFVCLQDTFSNLINKVPGSKYQYPTSKYSILKRIHEYNNIALSYHVQCTKCKKYSVVSKDEEVNCENCSQKLKAKESNFFITSPAIEPLKRDLADNWDLISEFYFSSNNIDQDSDISDFYNGQLFKTNYNNVPSSTMLLPLGLNTDGANVFKSNSMSIWPILIVQNYLPPNIRYERKHMVLAGLYYGGSKPDMKVFFQTIAEEFQSSEIIMRGTKIQFQVLSCCLDLPAKAAVQQIKQYNGESACNYCLHPGVKFEKSNMVRYGTTKNLPTLRTEIGTLQAMQKISHPSQKDKIIDGIKGLSPFVAFPTFNIIDGFCMDYMHNVLLGVMNNLLDFWLNSNYFKRKFYIKPKNEIYLNERILSIKPCSYIKRKARSLTHRSKFKANELRSMLLYYLPVCLRGILPKPNYDHFMQLSSSIYTLLGTSISKEQLDKTEEDLNEFVLEYEKAYGPEAIVMNVHLLRHLVHCVRNHGPLWTQSAFHFEDFNGYLLSFVKGPNDVLLQIYTKYLLQKSIRQNKLQCSTEEDGLLGKAEKIELGVDGPALKQKNIHFMQENWIYIHKRFYKKGQTYTSEYYTQAKKTIDYFLSFSNNLLGIVKYYFKVENCLYAMVRPFVVVNRMHHICEVEEKSETIVLNANDITEKLIYMYVNGRHSVVRPPNEIERD